MYMHVCVCVRVHLNLDHPLSSFTAHHVLVKNLWAIEVWSQSSSTSTQSFEASQLFVSNGYFTRKTGADPCSALNAGWSR